MPHKLCDIVYGGDHIKRNNVELLTPEFMFTRLDPFFYNVQMFVSHGFAKLRVDLQFRHHLS